MAKAEDSVGSPPQGASSSSGAASAPQVPRSVGGVPLGQEPEGSRSGAAKRKSSEANEEQQAKVRVVEEQKGIKRAVDEWEELRAALES